MTPNNLKLYKLELIGKFTSFQLMLREEEENDLKKIINKSFFQRLLKTIETNIYSFYFSLLDYKEESFLFYYLIVSVHFIQVIGYAFREDVINKKFYKIENVFFFFFLHFFMFFLFLPKF